MGGRPGYGGLRSRGVGEECFKERVMENLNDLLTLPWLCTMMEPPRKKPEINEETPGSVASVSLQEGKQSTRLFPPYAQTETRPRGLNGRELSTG